jgi:hypothetical protein
MAERRIAIIGGGRTARRRLGLLSRLARHRRHELPRGSLGQRAARRRKTTSNADVKSRLSWR